MAGWVKLHRSLLDNGLLCHPNANALFDWLLLTATYQDMHHPTKYGIIKLKRGQVVTGRKILADKLKQTEQKIRTALELLEKQEIITIETTKHYSIITLTNYDKYQGEDPDTTNEVTKPQPSLNQASTTEQEVKKSKNEKKEPKPLSADADESFMSFYNAYPRKDARADAWKAWKEKKPDLNAVLEALSWQCKQEQWGIRVEGKLKYVPMPASYLRGERWLDEKPYQKQPFKLPPHVVMPTKSNLPSF